MERVIDLPVPIVWDGLVDPVLVSGWLDPEETLLAGTRVRHLSAPLGVAGAHLSVDSPVFGEVKFALWRRGGGTRGSSTSLVVEIPDDRIQCLWDLRLTQLEEVLRGYPVDWRSWVAEHAVEARVAIWERCRADF